MTHASCGTGFYDRNDRQNRRKSNLDGGVVPLCRKEAADKALKLMNKGDQIG